MAINCDKIATGVAWKLNISDCPLHGPHGCGPASAALAQRARNGVHGRWLDNAGLAATRYPRPQATTLRSTLQQLWLSGILD